MMIGLMDVFRQGLRQVGRLLSQRQEKEKRNFLLFFLYFPPLTLVLLLFSPSFLYPGVQRSAYFDWIVKMMERKGNGGGGSSVRCCFHFQLSAELCDVARLFTCY